MRYGYARVSTKDQNLARQIAILNAYNVEKIFKEKESGAKLRRPIFTKVLTLLKPGDELIVSSLDRLSRDADHLTLLLLEINLKGAKLLALDVPDFNEVKNQNIQRLLRSMLLEVKKFMAAEERMRILERQRQGIELAKKRGSYHGRPLLYGPNVPDSERRKTYFTIKELLKSGLSITEIQRQTGKSRNLIRRIKTECDCDEQTGPLNI